ncbi:MAG TPA: hypothetical protein DCE44_12315 [Verrucomicrobiales bacterium]|nr:hypothetical protein [Verrucomicrobiales bacterium]
MLSEKFQEIIRDNSAGNHSRAAIRWAMLVGPRQEWDHKRILCNARKRPCPTIPRCKETITLCGMCFDCDVPSNIHYGYLGLVAGFSSETLIVAPGVVQKPPHWPLDDSRDSNAIELGIQLALFEGYPWRLPMLRTNSLCAFVTGQVTGPLQPAPKICAPCPFFGP